MALRRHLPAIVLLCTLSLALFASMRDESPTTDEAVHLTRGLAYFWAPDTSLSYAHPPLGNAIAALPVVLDAPRIDLGALPAFARGDVSALARRVFGDAYEARRVWFWQARTSIALLTLLFGAYFYVLCGRLWNRETALAGLLFFALHPSIVAHGRLVTTDMPVTFAMFVALGELVSFLSGHGVRHALFAGLATGLAFATKYTALALVPIASIVVLCAVWMQHGRYAGRRPWIALAEALALLGFLGLCALVTINAAYRFEHTGMRVDALLAAPEPQNMITEGYGGTLLERETKLPSLPGWLPIPLPYTYVLGISSVRAHDREGHGTTFLGQYQEHGTPAYFPVLLFAKTPTLLTFVLLFGAAWLLRTRRGASFEASALAFAAIMLLGLSMQASINIGVRHVLPILPLMAALGGRSAVHALGMLLGKLRDARTQAQIITAALLLHAGGMLWSFPDYLSDFSALVGGRRGGERISIVGEEWGQDTLRLGRALRAHGIGDLYFHADTFVSHLELSRFVHVTPLTCLDQPPLGSFAAINARDLSRARGRCYQWAKRLRPLFDVNGHVFVYRVVKPSKDTKATGARRHKRRG